MILRDICSRNRRLKAIAKELRVKFPEVNMSSLKGIIGNLGYKAGFDNSFWTFNRVMKKIGNLFVGARNIFADGIWMNRFVGMKMFEY